MEVYTGFADVYDILMDNVPYEKWGGYVHKLLLEYGIDKGTVLDLGCGTGTMTEIMSQFGYDMIGIDNSAEMLEVAVEKKIKSGESILYTQQDMRGFTLHSTVPAIYSVCDSLNYMTKPEELERVFQCVHSYLDYDGIFIFDFNTPYKYKEFLGDRTIAENREDCSFIWENYYYEEEQINEYELSLFIKEHRASREGQDIYRRYDETHFQRAYSLEEVSSLLKRTKFQFMVAYDESTWDSPSEISERIYVVAGKSAIKGEVP